MAGSLEPPGRRRSPAVARILATVALLAVTLAVIMVISASTDNKSDGRDRGGGRGGAARTTKSKDEDRPPKKYVIESGDSLIGIASRFGLTVEEIERLNPDVDPQALATGQELKLR
jgi:LysM repeat protein